jgi:hypothetical protein
MAATMETPPPNLPAGPSEPHSRTRLVAAVAVAIVFGVLAFFFSHSAMKQATVPAGTEPTATMSGEERAYLAKISVEHLEISRAENFLHQEVTTVAGDIANGSDRALASVELTIEFYDELNQIAQREKRSLFGPPGPPIQAGDHREFEVSFDHVSTAWNMRPPVVKATGIQFAQLHE